MSFIMGKNMTYFEKVLELVNDVNSIKDPQAIKKQAEKIRQTKEQRIQNKLEEMAKEEKKMVLDQVIKMKQLEEKQKQDREELERIFQIQEIKLKRKKESIELERLKYQ